MAVRVHDLSALRPPPSPSLAAFSVDFQGVFQDEALVPQAVVATGGTTPYSWSAVGLPAGVTIDPLTGIISGTPTGFGDSTATITVTDAIGATVAVPVFFEILQTAFSDNFNRPASNSLGPDWLQRLIWHNAGGAGNDETADAGITLAGTCQITVIGPGNPVAGGLYNTAFLPSPVYRNLYNKPRTFVETAWLPGSGVISLAGLCIRYNSELTNGGGINVADFYGLFFGPTGGVNNGIGDLTRITGGGNTILISGAAFAAGGYTLNSGDVVRVECEDTGAACVLTVRLNGVILGPSPFVDNAANRIRMGSPGYQWQVSSGIGLRFSTFDDFACGIF